MHQGGGTDTRDRRRFKTRAHRTGGSMEEAEVPRNTGAMTIRALAKLLIKAGVSNVITLETRVVSRKVHGVPELARRGTRKGMQMTDPH